MDLKDLLELQLHTLAVLAAGYLGYRIASLGRDAAHGPVDVLFQSLMLFSVQPKGYFNISFEHKASFAVDGV